MCHISKQRDIVVGQIPELKVKKFDRFLLKVSAMIVGEIRRRHPWILSPSFEGEEGEEIARTANSPEIGYESGNKFSFTDSEKTESGVGEEEEIQLHIAAISNFLHHSLQWSTVCFIRLLLFPDFFLLLFRPMFAPARPTRRLSDFFATGSSIVPRGAKAELLPENQSSFSRLWKINVAPEQPHQPPPSPQSLRGVGLIDWVQIDTGLGGSGTPNIYKIIRSK